MFDLLQLVIRGRVKNTVLDEVRTLHNQTAGHPDGVAAARSLGDLSHNVYVPLADDPKLASELLILDTWNSLEGMQKFFSDPQVQAGGAMMFASRDPIVGIPADIYSYALRAPKERPQRFVGLVRGKVKSREAAKAAFDKARGAINKARLAGIVSHQVFWLAPQPGQPAADELIGIDIWHDAEGMARYYADPAGAGIYDVFAEQPATSVWKQPPGAWTEW